jgi:hypothetical protein
MATKPDSASKRLSKFFAANRSQGDKLSTQTQKMIAELEAQFNGDAVDVPPSELDWRTLQEKAEQQIAKMRLASAAVDLSPNSALDAPLRAAFEAAGLNPMFPWHWRILFSYFAYAHFYKPRRGAPQKWTPDAYCELLFAYHQIKRRRPKLKDSAVCDALMKQGRWVTKSGTQISADRIGRALNEARDPAKNAFIATWLEENLRAARAEFDMKQISWTPEHESELAKKVIANICKWIGEHWGNK